MKISWKFSLSSNLIALISLMKLMLVIFALTVIVNVKVSCDTTTLGTTTELIPSTSESGAGAVTTVLPNVSSRTPATPAPTASPPDSASGNSDHQGNKTTGAGNSSSNKTEKDKSTHPRGEGGGANVLSLSYLTFLLTVVISYVMKNIEI